MKKIENKKYASSRAITLIALIITVIIMLILVAVSISIALNTGLFDNAGKATQKWKAEQEKESDLKVNIEGKEYDSVNDYVAIATMQIPWIYNENENGEIEITGIDLTKLCGAPNDDGYSVDVKIGTEVLKIPSKLNGKKVTRVSFDESILAETLSDEIWAGKVSDVKMIILESGIEELIITNNKVNFINIENIDLPNSIVSIGNGLAFAGVPVVNFSEGKNDTLVIPKTLWYAEKILIKGVEYVAPKISFTIIDENGVEHQFQAEQDDTWVSWVLALENQDDFFKMSEAAAMFLDDRWRNGSPNMGAHIGGYSSAMWAGCELVDSSGELVGWWDSISAQTYYLEM